MSEASQRYLSRWALRRRQVVAFGVVAGFGLIVHGIFFVFTSVPLGHGPSAENPTPWIEWRGGGTAEIDPMIAEQVVLFDSKPLFVPTEWNTASELGGIARLRDETELFVPFAAQVETGQGLWSGESPIRADASAGVRLESARAVTGGLFRRMGQFGAPATVLERRTASLAITPMSEAVPALVEVPLVGEGLPVPAELWTPVVFQILIDPLGEGGLPLRLNSSGIPEWDQALARALLSQPVLERLSVGYYRVLIGP